MSTDISNNDDVIDSRDICARIEELENDNDCPDNTTEIDMLRKLVEQIDDYAGDKAEDGVTLIRDSYFEEYAQQLAEDCGMLNESAQWPNNCIDWERAARELRMDYTSLDFDGITYWYR